MEKFMKNNIKHYIVNTVVILLLPVSLFAGNSSKKGTAGATELLLPVGAKGIALGGAMLSNSDGVDAVYWNPAGLAPGLGANGVQAEFSSTNYLEGVNISYVAIGSSVGQLGSLALTLKSIDFGKIDVTTHDDPDGNGSTFSPSYITLGLSYSKELTDKISVGTTVKLVNETIVRTSATGAAVDAGVIYKVSDNSFLKGLKFGIALKNIGTDMQFTGADLETSTIPSSSESTDAQSTVPVRYVAQSFELPTTYELGASYDYLFAGTKVAVSSAFQSSNFSDDYFRGGLEVSYEDYLFLRAGYILPTGSDQTQIQKSSFGGGVRIPLGTSFLVFDYAYASVQYFDPVHTISIGIAF
jgi:hypothetical protein